MPFVIGLADLATSQWTGANIEEAKSNDKQIAFALSQAELAAAVAEMIRRAEHLSLLAGLLPFAFEPEFTGHLVSSKSHPRLKLTTRFIDEEPELIHLAGKNFRKQFERLEAGKE